tara:strand:- start:477 stop:626 length:150 start_codon:yes stop_codon:yes gene_type:complete
MPKKEAAERQREYEQRLRDDGYRRLQLWVKAVDAEKVKLFAAELRGDVG